MSYKIDIGKYGNVVNDFWKLAVNFVGDNRIESLVGGGLIVGGMATWGIYQSHERKIEQDRHEEVEMAHCKKIQEQDAIIQNIKSSDEENRDLKQIILMLSDSSAGQS